jgi:hypothetical protein
MRIVEVVSLLLSVLVLGPAAAAPATHSKVVPFVLDSTESTYPFTIRVEGTYELNGDTLMVSVRAGEIRSAIPIDLGEEGVATDIRIAFGLGGVVKEGWRMEFDTPDQVLAPKLAPGKSVAFHELKFVVSGVAHAPLADQWLSVRLGVMQRLPGVPEGLLSSYACSEQNILGPNDASRERAKRMKTAYSHTC